MSNNKYKVLIVDDEANICSFIAAILESNGYQVLTAGTCLQGRLVFSTHNPDLIVLDLGLPDEDGSALIRTVREAGCAAPILVLSARSDESEKIAALDLGANDYITKPFGTGELLARVRAALRTVRTGAATPGEVFHVRGLTINYDARTVTLDGEEVRLTQTEFNIVALMAQHAGKVMTYSALIQGVWGTSDTGSIKKLQVNMANIRKKLGARPGENPYILNELGVGYRMYSE
ncbi:MAG TPA: response regulator transcription factor [Candidatus Gemmiger stercoripullorum]|nr:response regulator transcription factor [Candidatus Gemmiger stercoripullorum]